MKGICHGLSLGNEENHSDINWYAASDSYVKNPQSSQEFQYESNCQNLKKNFLFCVEKYFQKM